mgnify:CR=1 FL=1
MSALEKLQNEVERQKRKIEEIEKSIETVEKEFNVRFDEERDDIKKQKERLDNPDLQIAIVGTIKAGKSTFINALLQDNIATTDVTPETASLTKFIYKEENKLLVKFYDEKEWKKILADIEKSEKEDKGKVFKEEFESSGAKSIESQYIGKSDETIEVSNIEDLKNKVEKYTSKSSPINYFVKELTVYLNNENMPKDVTIVDTPGLDDLIAIRSNKTKDYIKEANAVIVCVDSKKLEGKEYTTITQVFENVGEDKYKVMILGTQIDSLNKPEEYWKKQSYEWKKNLKYEYKAEKLLEDNIIGVSSYVFSNLIELENGRECDEEAIIQIYKLAKSYGIELSLQAPNLKNKIIENSENIKDLTNIKKVKSLMNKIIANGEEEVIKDLEKRYLSVITNISNKAKSIKNTNSESKKTLDMTKAEQENFRIKKNKEIEEIEKAMNGLNKSFEKIKEEWLNQNNRLKEAIKK